MSLELIEAGPRQTLQPLTLAAQLQRPGLPAYGRLLHHVLNQDPSLSIRDDEAEESWRVVTPVLDAWSSGQVPLEEYPAGSDSPPPGHRSPDPPAGCGAAPPARSEPIKPE